MTAYIDFVGAVAIGQCTLSDGDLADIGEFTRENILRWFARKGDPTWVGIVPVEDFHAVCGDIEIPWATKECADFFPPTSD